MASTHDGNLHIRFCYRHPWALTLGVEILALRPAGGAHGAWKSLQSGLRMGAYLVLALERYAPEHHSWKTRVGRSLDPWALTLGLGNPCALASGGYTSRRTVVV